MVLSHNDRHDSLALSENVKVSTNPRTNKTVEKQPPTTMLKHLNGAQNRNWQEMMDQQ